MNIPRFTSSLATTVFVTAAAEQMIKNINMRRVILRSNLKYQRKQYKSTDMLEFIHLFIYELRQAGAKIQKNFTMKKIHYNIKIQNL